MNSTSKSDRPVIRKAAARWVQAVVLLIVFASGVASGVFGTSSYIFDRMASFRNDPNSVPTEIADGLRSKLSLNQNQYDQALAIIELRHRNITSLRNDIAPEIHSEFDQLESELSKILNESQTGRWSEIAGWVRETFLPLNPENPQR
ncbi:MAG: hypothetical protein AAF939_07950 [Planctomycetota bacterium]